MQSAKLWRLTIKTTAKTYKSNSQPRRSFGGDFELHDTPYGSLERLDHLVKGQRGTWTASGRSAFGLLLQDLQQIGVRHVHIPAFVCESILQPVHALGLDYSFYPVDSSLTALPDPPKGAALLLIHYFGWENASTKQLRAEAGRSFHLIEDATHSFLSGLNSDKDLGTSVFFSLRKFGPAPLGGWCSSNRPNSKPTKEMDTTFQRSIEARALRSKYLNSPKIPVNAIEETAYLSILADVEEFLNRHSTTHAVSSKALHVAAGIDWGNVTKQRKLNWLALRKLTSTHIKPLMANLPAKVVPIGYVIQVAERDRIRQKLTSRRVFCPVHWPLPTQVDIGRFPDANTLSKTLLTVPIDQRYKTEDMNIISKALVEAVSHAN